MLELFVKLILVAYGALSFMGFNVVSFSVAVASAEESPVSMKLKKTFLKAPSPEESDTASIGKFLDFKRTYQ